MVEGGDVFVEFYVYYFVVVECMYGLGFCFGRFDEVQWFGDWYLVDYDLFVVQGGFWYLVVGLDYCCFWGLFGGGDFGGVGEEMLDGYCVGGVVGVLVDYFEYVVGIEDGCGYLYVVGVLVVGQWYFVVVEGYLVVGDCYCFEQVVVDYVFGLFVEVGEVVVLFWCGVGLWGKVYVCFFWLVGCVDLVMLG